MNRESIRQIATSGEQMAWANGVELCAQSFGDEADPVILLIHGATASMMAWDEEFCRRLAAGQRYVIRYDHRDTGRSVSYEPGAPPYAFDDLVADAIGLLDAFQVERAHLVGTSMGGGIAMLAALDYPERVASLTLIGTSPGGDDLPPMSEAFLEHISGGESPDWSDKEAVTDHIMRFLRVVSGGSGRLDEEQMRPLIAQDVERTRNVASSQINHYAMRTEGSKPLRERIGMIAEPTLVIHGDMDPVFPLGHAEAMEREIPGARLLVLERTGHEIPRSVWDTVIPAIQRHSASQGPDQALDRESSAGECDG